MRCQKSMHPSSDLQVPTTCALRKGRAWTPIVQLTKVREGFTSCRRSGRLHASWPLLGLTARPERSEMNDGERRAHTQRTLKAVEIRAAVQPVGRARFSCAQSRPAGMDWTKEGRADGQYSAVARFASQPSSTGLVSYQRGYPCYI